MNCREQRARDILGNYLQSDFCGKIGLTAVFGKMMASIISENRHRIILKDFNLISNGPRHLYANHH